MGKQDEYRLGKSWREICINPTHGKHFTYGKQHKYFINFVAISIQTEKSWISHPNLQQCKIEEWAKCERLEVKPFLNNQMRNLINPKFFN